MSDTREVSSREKLRMNLLTMCMSTASTGTKNALMSVVRKMCGVVCGATYVVDVSEGVHERTANGFDFLHFFSSWAILPKRSKVQKRSLKTKALPQTNEVICYPFLVTFPT